MIYTFSLYCKVKKYPFFGCSSLKKAETAPKIN